MSKPTRKHNIPALTMPHLSKDKASQLAAAAEPNSPSTAKRTITKAMTHLRALKINRRPSRDVQPTPIKSPKSAVTISISVSERADPMVAQACVRMKYLESLLEELRGYSGEKRIMAETYLLKVAEKEMNRASDYASRKADAFAANISALQTAVVRLSSPFCNSKKQLYAIRPFLRTFQRQSASMAPKRDKGFPVMDPMFDEYLVDLREQAKKVAKKTGSGDISDSLKVFVRMETDFRSLLHFIAKSISDIDELTRNLNHISSANGDATPAQPASGFLSALHLAQTLSLESRAMIAKLVSDLVPDLETYECAVCLATLYEPVQLQTCKHRFCSECLHQHERFSAFWAYLYWIDVQCPICRGSYTGRCKFQDVALNNLIKTYFPREHNAKGRTELQRKLRRKFILLVRKKIVWRDTFWEG
ncbi:uncharacterized protein EV422DRAFT_151768 [Fimicolochytrium jonesii]|uniref:uncharacterized protein n=1 Tax=Fimicolochytrium jonesii TaxID=1396493 RepID=UPI0022FDCA9F|nr:uncharacterized protein EV422DRAFT_151768 [Fimicolochytrium jonesii]KAI8826063.1 hypothetical protein EV422DRAFT_151768 [Fimicolochytrium jonesii]